MNYSRGLTPRDKGRRLSLRAVVLVFGLLVVVAGVLVWRKGAEATLWRVLSPVLSLRNALTSSDAAALREQLARTEAALADRDFLYKENVELKARLGRPSLGGERRTLAAVLQRPPGVPYDTFVIDIGQTSDITAGDLVSAGGSTALGEVTEVLGSTARVTLYSSPGSEHRGLLNGTVPLTLVGEGAGSFTAALPTGTVVEVGDAVVFPGIAGELPAKVAGVESPAGESFMHIYLHLPVNIFELRYVEVIH